MPIKRLLLRQSVDKLQCFNSGSDKWLVCKNIKKNTCDRNLLLAYGNCRKVDKKLNVKNSNLTQLIACVLTLSGLFFSVRFFMQVEFNINPQVWFSAQYYEQFIPFYIAIILLLSGVFVFTKYSQANLYLASFGLI